MKRILLFLLAFAIVAGVVFLLVVGINYGDFKTLYENREGMAEGSEYVENTYSLKGLTEFIGEHPEYVSITSFNTENPDSGIFYQSDTPRTLGTTANILLLIEYERQVTEGILNPEEQINPSDFEIYALPEISEVSFQDEITLEDAVSAMISENMLAVADYLWFRLGEENIRRLVESLSLPESSLPLPFSGMYINIHPTLSDTSILAQEGFEEFAQRSIEQAKSLKENESFQKKVKEQFSNDRLSLTFMEERDALEYFPKASTNQLSKLMYQLIKGEDISAEVAERVLEKLRWPINSEPISRNFEDYGAVYDNRMGLLGGIDFGTSIYDGSSSVQAVYFDRLPVGFWVHLSANHMHEDFQQRLMWDPALFEATISETGADNE